MNKRKVLIMMLLAIVLAACSGSKVENPQFDFLADMGITVTDKLLLGDSISLPDIYCGDSDQDNEVDGKELNWKQYDALIVPAGIDFTDVMSRWLLLGVRDMGHGNTLAAYYAGSSIGYCVNLMTYDSRGKLLDAINVRELHLLWRVDIEKPDDNSVYTLDGSITFDSPSGFTLHRAMGRCIMDYDKGLKGAPQWKQYWDQAYSVNDKGHFVLLRQNMTRAEGKVDPYAVMDFRSWDLLACSLHDPGVMNFWNDYEPSIGNVYSPDYRYNPFPWDVTKLYEMNPSRFLNWMAARGDNDNRLLPYFKLSPDQRPALLEQINRLSDPAARQWLTALVNSWDDKPLTQHL